MFLTAIISAVIGGLLVLTLSPALVKMGLLPQEYFSRGNAPLSEGAGPTQSVSVDVNNDITKAVQQVRPAVVGVVNIQESGGPFNQEACAKWNRFRSHL